MHDTGQDVKAAGGALRSRWSDYPWCSMTTGEAEAWRKGYEAAKAQARERAEAKSEWHKQQGDFSFGIGADKAWACHRGGQIAAKDLANFIGSMEPPA